MILTGSRAFGVAGEDSDWDYVSYMPPIDRCWKPQSYNIGDGYLVYRHANRNLILCLSVNAWDRWMQAHRHCVIERPGSKDRRKVIFDHYMYGTPLDRTTPIPREYRAWFQKKLEAR